ncbi:UBX domain-containing protein 8 isoform X3 [Cricetulus griseus]|uniref:UBX domain-containing protein 8 isoform X3 n=1 Tax=Cricetulus griseus TaxID=10029 RepID=A0A9J7F4D0_CRIGR|nr:UBX domain-containing protein 8 isoform X3 [Cricetulus griseus]XP_027247083.1 UBX domain-containing protein 8 isoform X3 [Cricetulus griseus]
MASRGVVGLFLLSALPLLCLELRRGIPSLGIKDLILLSGRIFLLLALLTLVISVATSWFNSCKPSRVHLTEGEEENEKRQRLVRKKQQEAQGEQASRYIQNVLKPQQEMKLKKLEERFYQMTGETWKLTTGHKLEVPNLPEEPPETAEEVVTVALRCPSGSVLRRRFFKSWNSQVLLDWMMKIGYHKSIYSLSTSFPRRPLETEGGLSLEDIGITVDTVLNVEEKEQSGQ